MCSVYAVSSCKVFLIEVLFQVLSEFGNSFFNIRFEIIVFCDTVMPNELLFMSPRLFLLCKRN